MKIGNRGGHTKTSYGAVGVIDEYVEDRKLIKRVNELLSQYHTIIDCTPDDTKGNGEWNLGVKTANNNKVDICFSIHFNSASGGANGSECLVASNCSAETKKYANRVLENLKNLGFKNRGIKNRDDLAETTGCTMPSMIIEVCFVQDPDATLYKKLGIEKVARAIANGIDSRIALNQPEWKKNSNGWWYDLGNGDYPKEKWLEINGEWYYFDKDGYAYNNKWLKYKEKWYYFDENCKMISKTIRCIKDKWYAFNSEGVMLSDCSIDINSNGELIFG